MKIASITYIDSELQLEILSNAVDMKQLFFEAKNNEQIGNSNRNIYKQLIKMCPDYISAYIMLRREVLKKEIINEVESDEETAATRLIRSFYDVTMLENSFVKLLEDKIKIAVNLLLSRNTFIEMQHK